MTIREFFRLSREAFRDPQFRIYAVWLGVMLAVYLGAVALTAPNKVTITSPGQKFECKVVP